MRQRHARPRRKKPIPAALATTRHLELQDGTVRHFERPLVEQLAPTHPLRLRRVASDPDVQEALELTKTTHAKVVQAREVAASTPEAAAAYACAVRAHRSILRDVLVPAILEAETGRRELVALTPPDHTALARAVGRGVNGDRILAVDNLLRRNPHWKDLALWTAPDCRRYLAKTLRMEARFVALRRRAADRPAISRGERPFLGPSESAVLRSEQARLKRVRDGLRLLQRLYQDLPADQRRIVIEMARQKCGPYAAARRLGLARSTAVALRARAERLIAKQRQNVRRAALH